MTDPTNSFWRDLSKDMQDEEFEAAYQAAFDETLILDRLANDTGVRFTLDEALEMLGITREELEEDND